jgi:hypothetical protein
MRCAWNNKPPFVTRHRIPHHDRTQAHTCALCSDAPVPKTPDFTRVSGRPAYPAPVRLRPPASARTPRPAPSAHRGARRKRAMEKMPAGWPPSSAPAPGKPKTHAGTKSEARRRMICHDSVFRRPDVGRKSARWYLFEEYLPEGSRGAFRRADARRVS